MPLFKCDNCGCIDNTALGGTRWSKDLDIWPDDVAGKALCVECAPTHYKDGRPNPEGGKWHGRFPKRTPEEAGYLEGNDGFYYTAKELAPGGYFERYAKPDTSQNATEKPE